MNEAGGPEAERALKPNEQVATMSSEEKTVTCVLLSIPVFMAVSTGVMALILKAKPGHLNSPEVQSSARFFLIFLVASAMVFICLPIPFFFKMIRRKMRTGSIYPSGDELKARRARRPKSYPLWLTVTRAAIWGVGAGYFSYSALTNPHSRGLVLVVAASWWLMAVGSIRKVFQPDPPKES